MQNTNLLLKEKLQIYIVDGIPNMALSNTYTSFQVRNMAHLQPIDYLNT